MIGAVSRSKVQDGKEDDFIAVFKTLKAEVDKNEDGTLLYEMFRCLEDRNTFVIIEKYQDQAAAERHMAAAYFQTASAKIAALIDGEPQVEMFEPI